MSRLKWRNEKVPLFLMMKFSDLPESIKKSVAYEQSQSGIYQFSLMESDIFCKLFCDKIEKGRHTEVFYKQCDILFQKEKMVEKLKVCAEEFLEFKESMGE